MKVLRLGLNNFNYNFNCNSNYILKYKIKEQPTEASCSRGGNVLDSFKYLFYIIFSANYLDKYCYKVAV